MAKSKQPRDRKEAALVAGRSLNPHPERVRSERFHDSSFFDPRDLVQVKYEMLREVEHDGVPISQAASDFGLSRPSFYQAREDFDRGGIPALAGKKRGPKRAHKITDEILHFVEQEREKHAGANPAALVAAVLRRFQVKVHPRSIERAVARKKAASAESVDGHRLR